MIQAGTRVKIKSGESLGLQVADSPDFVFGTVEGRTNNPMDACRQYDILLDTGEMKEIFEPHLLIITKESHPEAFL